MAIWHLELPESPSPVVQRIAALLQRQVAARCGAALPLSGDAQHRLALAVAPGPGPEGFRLEEDPRGGLRLTGHDERGLLYGVGKLLRDASYGGGGFAPGSWRGQSRPDKPLRGIYFATHFHNWYHEAPVKEIERYVEELALWGYNTVCVWFDMHHYQDIAELAAQAMLARLIAILSAAKRIGLNTSTLFLANEAYASSPVPLRADWTAGHDGYHREIGSYRVELCPSKPGATELILQWAEERSRFAPHPFDQATADRLCAAIDYTDTIPLVATVRDDPQEQVVAYFICALGVAPVERERYARAGIALDPLTDCTVAPSVADACQDRGLGSLLMGHLIQVARRLGRKRMVLMGGVQATNTRAVHYYQKHGFRMVNTFESPAGFHNYDMMLDL